MDLKTLNTPEDLLSGEDYKKYSTALYPFGLPILYNALMAKLGEDPDYEVFVPVVYYKLRSTTPKNDPQLWLNIPEYLISNRGQVVSIKLYAPKVLKPLENEIEGTDSIYFKYGSKRESMEIGRAIACNFLPLPTGVGNPAGYHLGFLDDDPQNKSLPNLKWVLDDSQGSASQKKFESSEPENPINPKVNPIKVTIMEGEHAGFKFVISSLDMLENLGFNTTTVWRCCNGLTTHHMGCIWGYATEDEIKSLPNNPPTGMVFRPYDWKISGSPRELIKTLK
jgi:hypothetical protein